MVQFPLAPAWERGSGGEGNQRWAVHEPPLFFPYKRFGSNRQMHRHGCAPIHFAVHRDGAAVFLDDAIGYREAKAGSGRLAATQCALGCHKWLEDFVDQFWRNATTSIADTDFDLALALTNRFMASRALVTKFNTTCESCPRSQ